MSTPSASSLLSALYMVIFMTPYELKPSILSSCIPNAVNLYAGDSFNSSLVAIVAVEPEVLKAWAASEGIQVKISLNSCLHFSPTENCFYTNSILKCNPGIIFAMLWTIRILHMPS